jgi:predicted RNase H-like nuclease
MRETGKDISLAAAYANKLRRAKEARRTLRTKRILGHRFTLLNKIRAADLSFRHRLNFAYPPIKFRLFSTLLISLKPEAI